MTQPWERAKETSTGQLRYRVSWDGIGVEFVSDEEMERPAVDELALNAAPAYASQSWALGGGTGAVTDDSASPGAGIYEDPVGGQDAWNISDLDTGATVHGTVTSSGTTGSIEDGNTLLIELWVQRIAGGSAFAQVSIGRGGVLTYPDSFSLHLEHGWVRRAAGSAIEWVQVEPANNHSRDWWRVLVRVRDHDTQARVRVAPAAGPASSWLVGSRSWSEATDDAAVHGTPLAGTASQGSCSVWGLYIRDFTTYADTRQRIAGLNADGLRMEEKGDEVRGKWEPSGFKLRVLMEAATALFHTDPSGYTYLDEDEVTDTASAMRVLGTDAFPDSGVLYQATETFFYRGRTGDRFWGLTRGLWSADNLGAAGPTGQAAQYHYRSSEFVSDDRLHVPEITNAPVIFEGRRVTVYVYAPGDDPQGDGTRVWSGICSTDPTADGDYWTWTVDPLSRIFSHDLASDVTDDFGIRGIYYTRTAPLSVQAKEYNSSSKPASLASPVREVTFNLYGFFESNAELIDCVNHILSLETSSFAGWSTTVLAAPLGRAWTLQYRTPASGERWISLGIWSAIDGYGPPFTAAADGLARADATIERSAVSPGSSYSAIFYQVTPPADLRAFDGTAWGMHPPDGLGQAPRTTHQLRFFSGGGAADYSYQSTDGLFDAANLSTGVGDFPNDRLHINTPVQLDPGRTAFTVAWEPPVTSGVTLSLGVGGSETTWEIFDFDPVNRSVITRPMSPNVRRVAGSVFFSWDVLATPANLPTIRVTRRYTGAAGGSLADFIQRLLDDRARYLNLGITPDLRRDDFAANWDARLRADASRASLLSQRRYVAGSSIELDEMIEHELRLGGWYAHFDVDGRISFRALETPSSVEVVQAYLDVDQLIADGFWYRYEPAQMGIFNMVIHSTGYDPIEDEHLGSPWNFRWKRGWGRVPGARSIEVKPRSIDPERLPEHDSQRLIGAARVLATYGERYAVLTVQVLLELFDVVRGDVVEVTWSKLPNAQGGLGATTRARVIGRSWAPSSDGFGTLTLLISRARVGGYAPGAKVTSITGTSGTTGPFTVEFDLAQYFPADTDASDFLEVGDEIEVFRWGGRIAKRVTATITAVGTDSITFTTAAAWAHAAHGLGWAWGALPATEYATTDNLARYAFSAGRDARVDFTDDSVPRFEFAP